MEPVSPLELNRIMVGHVAFGLLVGKQVTAAVSERPAAGVPPASQWKTSQRCTACSTTIQSPEPFAAGRGQSKIVAVHRPVAAHPGGPTFDKRPELTTLNQFHPVAIPRVRAALVTHMDDHGRVRLRDGQQSIARRERQRQRLLGVEVFARADDGLVSLGVDVTGKGRNDRVDVRPFPDLAR